MSLPDTAYNSQGQPSAAQQQQQQAAAQQAQQQAQRTQAQLSGMDPLLPAPLMQQLAVRQSAAAAAAEHSPRPSVQGES